MMPLRTMLDLPGGGAVMGLMPSYLGGLEAVGVKVIAEFPANFGTEYDTHQGVVLFFDTERGLLRAIVDATVDHRHPHGGRERPGHRPAGEARRRRPGDHRRRHAGAHAPAGDARRAARAPGARVQPCRPTAPRRSPSASRGCTGLKVEAVRQRRGGRRRRRPHLHGDDGHEPVVRGDWVRPGAHINAVGAYTPDHARARFRRWSRSRASTPTGASRCSASPASSSSPGARGSSATSTSSARSARCSPARRRCARRRERDHAVQVARHRHRGPGRGAPRVRRGPGARPRPLGRDRRPALRGRVIAGGGADPGPPHAHQG